MTTFLLLAIPWGYLLAAIFLLIAIILFIVAIFMKDTGDNYEEALDDRRYHDGNAEDDYTQTSYEDTFDRYQNHVGAEDSGDSLQDMIAETSEDLSETRKFSPITDQPAQEVYEESARDEEPEDIEPVYTESEEVEEAAPELPTKEPEAVAAVDAADDDDEFDEQQIRPKRGRFVHDDRDPEDEDVPKPIAKHKSGMSFAEEVRRLIEEEERKGRD